MPPRNSYAKGRAKREEILEIALASLAAGNGGTATLADIAKAAGVTRSTLLYHFNSREELFAEVVRWRDEVDKRRDPPEGLLPGYVALAAHNAKVPGLVHLFTTLSAEATTPDHAAHGYFEERYTSLIDRMTGEISAAQAAGTVTADADADVLARIYVAVMDGLQVQWLYDGSTDMPHAIATLLGLMTKTNTARRSMDTDL
ncbi:MAG: transcriptional regulator, TetR family [Microbacterium sp.]|uniref:TetR/AcrR family transcriptional regulator n=1 Tax=Microbacterium sp. TaxID=51671 RepID=UPI002631899D|nr:TetR/AcrR family transcriptional regulator [Microbacterium sp.]MDF2560278.1 transcriptional regulator, TetR family [Microbacterium sp.]